MASTESKRDSKESGWECRRCTGINEFATSNCVICSAIRPIKWNCAECTLTNYNTMKCEACGYESSRVKDTLETEKSKVMRNERGHWNCPLCNTFNLPGAKSCRVCSAADGKQLILDPLADSMEQDKSMKSIPDEVLFNLVNDDKELLHYSIPFNSRRRYILLVIMDDSSTIYKLNGVLPMKVYRSTVKNCISFAGKLKRYDEIVIARSGSKRINMEEISAHNLSNLDKVIVAPPRYMGDFLDYVIRKLIQCTMVS